MTLDMPASMILSTQGGVEPWCVQGSNETYMVAPWVFKPAISIACTSACLSPFFKCAPKPTILPFLTTTDPTGGLTPVCPFTIFAN